jgi:excisionase family DNA binding protein
MATNTQEIRYLSVSEVASRLGVSAHTVRRKIHMGELPAVRLGDDGPLRVDAGRLDAWLRDHAVRGGDAA